MKLSGSECAVAWYRVGRSDVHRLEQDAWIHGFHRGTDVTTKVVDASLGPDDPWPAPGTPVGGDDAVVGVRVCASTPIFPLRSTIDSITKAVSAYATPYVSPWAGPGGPG